MLGVASTNFEVDIKAVQGHGHQGWLVNFAQGCLLLSAHCEPQNMTVKFNDLTSCLITALSALAFLTEAFRLWTVPEKHKCIPLQIPKRVKWAGWHLLPNTSPALPRVCKFPLEPAGDAEAENMGFVLPSIRLLFSSHKIREWEKSRGPGGVFWNTRWKCWHEAHGFVLTVCSALPSQRIHTGLFHT